MEVSEYQNIFRQEKSHFFYVGTHDLVLNLLKHNLPKMEKQNLKDRLKILDAGCGMGLLLLKMKQFGDVMGIDINSQAVVLAKKRGLRQIYQASVEKIPFRDNSFDVVTCIDVLYHQQVKDDLGSLEELYRVLKPGGILIIRVPAFRWLGGKHDELVQTKRRYNGKELNNKLAAAGFQIRRISYSNMFLLPIVFLKRKVENILPYSSVSVSDIFELPPLLNKILILILKLETQLLTFANLPLGVSVMAVAEKPKF